MILGKDGTGNYKRKHYIALYGELTVVEAMDLLLRQNTMWIYESKTPSNKTVYYKPDMFRMIAIIGGRKDTYGKIYRIFTLILIKDNTKKQTFLSYIYIYMYMYICWRSVEMYQSYKIVFLMAQPVGTSTLLHCSTRSKRATKHALYLELLYSLRWIVCLFPFLITNLTAQRLFETVKFWIQITDAAQR